MGRYQPTGSATAAELLAAALACSQHFAARIVGQTPAELFGNLNWGSLPDVKAAEHEAILKYASCTDADPEHLRAIRQCFSLIVKNTAAGAAATDDERRERCYSKFLRAQGLNRRTVRRLTHYFAHPSRMPATIGALLGRAQMELFWLLGPAPSAEDWDRFVRAKVFSSGVVQGLSRLPGGLVKDTSGYGKMAPETVLTSTRACLQRYGGILFDGPYLEHVLQRRFPEQSRECLRSPVLGTLAKDIIRECFPEDRDAPTPFGKFVEYSEGTSVYKDAGIDRFIAIEPLCNAMAQQGIAAMLNPYLLRWGITLEDQGRNREAARKASSLGFHPRGKATIDLADASTCIVRVFAAYMFPPGWFELFDAARTTSVSLDGKLVDGYASFVTMGNATTFPMQCLLFAALTRAAISLCECQDRSYRVYGDDIIVPLSASALLIEALRFCGFRVNVDKSYVTGFFRESCGGDYLHGADVAPVRLRESLSHMSTRHVFFNNLQRVFPGHPVLPLLYDSVSRPLIGPARDVDSPSAGYFECPTWLLHERRRSWYNKSTQSWNYRISALTPIPVKLWRVDDWRTYLAILSGERSKEITFTDRAKKKEVDRWSDLRDTVTWHVRETTVGWIHRLAAYAPFWLYMSR
jgi:hypothetical protein